ncbi:sugar phosphate isomerase/epimerase family protein [Halalkalibacter urbisdiaboli]|uniref:sugar phosphate isomerase/epimerase family protein n=1 Tax=Halalkalibacter urbisdiaboli TaxID=1960589 RepID=UPI000B449497|nr:sugar phosphate isomerase/epimerase [Halalkalibacter urbisdiaboli]
MLPLGVQLYTLRDETEKDFVGTLKKVKEIGYEGVEFAGFGGHSAEEMKKILNKLELQAISSHVPLDQLENDLENVIHYHVTLGIDTIICPFIPEEYWTSKDKYVKLAAFFNQVGEACKQSGLQFCYHHHAFEFEIFDGEYALDILLANTDPELVKLECDVYWVEYAKLSPTDYMKKYSGRCPLVHLKDMKLEPEKTFAEVGTGVIDIDAVIKTAEEIGATWLIVEQDVCERPPLESIQISYSNVMK